jgi:hypothetical protein
VHDTDPDASTLLTDFLPLGKESALSQEMTPSILRTGTYFLLARVPHMLIRLEQRPDVERLPSPETTVHRPVE